MSEASPPSTPSPTPPSTPAATAPLEPSVPREDHLRPDPLLDSLIEICRLHGHGATRASLSAGLPLSKGQLTLDLVERAAARAGMVSRLVRGDAWALEPAAFPVVVPLSNQQACVLLGIENGNARLLLPETGQGLVTWPIETLRARAVNLILYVRPHFRFDERSPAVKPPREAHWFWSAVLAQRYVYRDVLIAAALVNLFALATPLFSMNVYDRVVPNAALETLWALAVGVCLMMVGDLLLRKMRSRFVDEASARIDVQISSRLMERVLGMRLENRPESVGSFAQNLRGFEQVRDFIASSTVTVLIDLPFALLFVVVVFIISPWMALPVIAGFAAMLAAGWVIQGRLHALAETTYRASSARNATLIEALSGIETIKSQGAESVIQARWERANVFLASTNVEMRSLSSGASYVTMTLSQLVNVVGIVLGVYLIGERMLTMGGLVACGMLAGRALAPAGQIVGLLMQYQGARTALEGLETLMAKPTERPEDTLYVQRQKLRGDIEFRGVSFKYPQRSDSALNGISLNIAAGERVALIGRVGSGKSTIQRLIMGLYQPTEGAVLVDGIDLRQLDPADLRRNVASVSQDVTLFYGSLRDNITFGLPYADDGAILAAAEVAGLSEFVGRHPEGFDLNVGERGESLSGGQRQAVGLARAMLHNTPVLLLDEPTSAMDFSTEGAITRRLNDLTRGKTVVLVTHRTSLLALVDRVIVIDAGKVVADGPRDRILEALQSGRIAKAAAE